MRFHTFRLCFSSMTHILLCQAPWVPWPCLFPLFRMSQHMGRRCVPTSLSCIRVASNSILSPSSSSYTIASSSPFSWTPKTHPAIVETENVCVCVARAGQGDGQWVRVERDISLRKLWLKFLIFANFTKAYDHVSPLLGSLPEPC